MAVVLPLVLLPVHLLAVLLQLLPDAKLALGCLTLPGQIWGSPPPRLQMIMTTPTQHMYGTVDRQALCILHVFHT